MSDSTNNSKPWEDFAAQPKAGPWDDFKPTEVNIPGSGGIKLGAYEPPRDKGIWAGITGGVGGAWDQFKETAGTNPLNPTEAQEASAWAASDYLGLDPNSTSSKIVRTAVKTPQIFGNILGYGVDVPTATIAGALGGARAGYRGQDPTSDINSAKRELYGIMESEMGRFGAPSFGTEDMYRRSLRPIESPAILDKAKGVVDTGPNHAAIREAHPELPKSAPEGFVDASQKFMGRRDAREVANATGQADARSATPLHSEDLKPTKQFLPPTANENRLPVANENKLFGANENKPPDIREATPLQPEGLKQPESVGAAVAPKQAPPPDTPSLEHIMEVDDRLFKLRQQITADRAEMTQRFNEMPKSFVKPDTQKRSYMFGEKDPQGVLSTKERTMYDRFLQPLKDEEERLATELADSDVSLKDYNPDYMRRMVKGKNPQFDAFLEGAQDPDPRFSRTGPIRTSTGSQKERVYFTLVDASGGDRQVVALKGNKIFPVGKNASPSAIKGYKVLPDAKGNEELKPGAKILKGQKVYTLEQSWTREVKEQTGVDYYMNAIANTMDNVIRLRAIKRALAEIKVIKDSPEGRMYIKPLSEKNIPKGYRRVEVPGFYDYVVHPRLANVFDDYYKHSPPEGLAAILQRIGHFMTGTMFWSPVVHMGNEGAHWAVGRGTDWYKPAGWAGLAKTFPMAVREVATQGKLYQAIMREGPGFIYGGIANQDFYQKLLKKMGEEVMVNHSKWDPIARTMGVGPSTLVKMIYDWSNKALWASHDIFLMQRVLELKNKGMSTAQAIHEAEKHIPNYRIPPEVLGSRAVSELLTNPNLTVFSRYHYGMLKAWGHLIKDLASKSKGDQIENMGRLFTLGLMGLVIWPAMSKGVQKLSGNEHLSVGPRGPLNLPHDIYEVAKGDKNPLSVLSNLVTIAPATKTALELFPSNLNWFTGKRIMEPGDLKDPRHVGRVLGQAGEHIAQNAIQPYGMVAQADRSGKSLAKSVLMQGLGIKENDPVSEWKKQKAKQFEEKEALKRRRKPRGPIESLMYKAEELY